MRLKRVSGAENLDSNVDKPFNQAMFEFISNVNLPNFAPLYKYAEYYGVNSLIHVLINFKAKKVSQAKPMFFKTKDSGAAKEMKMLNGKWKDSYEKSQFKKIKSAAVSEEIYLDDISVMDKEYFRMKRLFTRPNEWQTFSQFLYSISAFQDISGWGLIHKARNGSNLVAMNSMPTHVMKIKGGTSFDPISGYLMDGVITKQFDKDECIRLATFSTSYDKHGSHLYGTSKVGAGYSELLTYIETKNREYTSAVTGDSAHILFPKNENDSLGEDVSAWKTFKESIFGALRNKDKHQAAVSGIALEHINLASALKDANTKEVKMDVKENLAAIWDLPVRLVFNSQEGGTYNNVIEDRKNALRNGVFPFLNDLEEVFHSEIVKPEFGLSFTWDYDCYEELNPDILKEMEAMGKVPFVSINEARDWFDFESIKNEKADIPQALWEQQINPINLDYPTDTPA